MIPMFDRKQGNYPEYLTTELALPAASSNGLTALDLFAGCGGLALGFEAAGFKTIGYEVSKDACATYRKNLLGVCHEVNLKVGLDLVDHAEVIIGGPPCQPFSVLGHQNGSGDSRD